ncbi:hypothetical protein R1flu_000644 [Riccia fluitans]|uniref:Uncharacterized protein n=1 Tax=Riccia fluitans TaxID=41844 RepID=A0ABD1Y1Z0_9MARC
MLPASGVHREPKTLRSRLVSRRKAFSAVAISLDPGPNLGKMILRSNRPQIEGRPGPPHGEPDPDHGGRGGWTTEQPLSMDTWRARGCCQGTVHPRARTDRVQRDRNPTVPGNLQRAPLRQLARWPPSNSTS